MSEIFTGIPDAGGRCSMRGQTVNQPLYDVFDINQNKVIITRADSQSISDQIGIKKYKVSEYELYKRQFQRRYVFKKVYEPEGKVSHPSESKTKLVQTEFDMVMAALRMNYTPERLSRIQFVCKI
jgi:hypothetical protein